MAFYLTILQKTNHHTHPLTTTTITKTNILTRHILNPKNHHPFPPKTSPTNKQTSMMQPENSPEYSVLDNFLAGNGFNYGLPAAPTFCSPSFSPTEFAEKHEPRNNCTASQNHKEAERKRRERINAHLHSLRSILLCNSKVCMYLLDICSSFTHTHVYVCNCLFADG